MLRLAPLTGRSIPGPEPVWANGERWQEMEKILILDGKRGSALAATRSLEEGADRSSSPDETKRTLAVLQICARALRTHLQLRICGRFFQQLRPSARAAESDDLPYDRYLRWPRC